MTTTDLSPKGETRTKFDLQQYVTDRIMAAIEAGTPPWRKPWTGSAGGAFFPLRANGVPYRGINVLLLWLEAAEKGYGGAHWFTYRQATELGAQVRKGERSSTVVKYGTVERETEAGDEKRIGYLRAYRVFNADQIDGLPKEFARTPNKAQDMGTEIDAELMDFFAGIGVTIETSKDPRAYYDPKVDRIHMPPAETFHSNTGYFGTLAHESLHATGHKSRLDRFTTCMSRKDVAREELLAEIGGAMLCVALGIEPETRQNAAYVSSWLKALADDKRLIFTAASAAQVGVDYIIEAARHADREAA
ncbi:MAG: zincin-like metallopeptidase domain-containing protein [Henriciella sp.]|uniref:ArdC family protein n=1 Tax=Henriciella sp. TaxID=1968823 RepID=UPI003C77931C